MKQILEQLFNHNPLNENQAHNVLTRIASGEYNDAQISAFITTYLMRTISIEEMKGFRSALWKLCIPVDLEGIETIDVCGTGGDGKNTFNISTLSAFVIAGAGYKVTKHGNYGVSSVCGSSNVLESLGYKFTNNIDTLKLQLDKSNICFFHAPLFHPAMKNVAPIRKQLGVKTFFNMLGPLINPAKPTHQMTGVFNLQLLRIYNYLFNDSNTTYSIVHSLDGYDEVSLTGKFKWITNKGSQIIHPKDIGVTSNSQYDIEGGHTIKEAKEIFVKILKNQATDKMINTVVVNSAIGIKTLCPNKSLNTCMEEAKLSIESGKAYNALKQLIALN